MDIKQLAAAPVFIVGAPRSGTSLVYKSLCLHDEVSYISNWLRRTPGVAEVAALNRLGPRFPQFRKRAWFGGGNAYAYGHSRGLAEQLFVQPTEGEPVFAHCGVPSAPSLGELSVASVSSESLALLRKTIGLIEHYSGGRVFVNKRIANNQRIPLLLEAFPEARFIHIVRDGRAVAYSCSRVDWWPNHYVWWYGGTPQEWGRSGNDPWELCARNWLEELHSLEVGLSVAPAEQVIQLRYEDLVAAPVDALTRLATFMGLPESPDWQGLLLTLPFPDKNEAWRDKMPDPAINLVEKIQHEALVSNGYSI